MTVIRDPSTAQGVKVNSQGELSARAVMQSEIEHASSALGQSYSWDSTELDIDAGDTMLFVKNTGVVPLILDRIIINGSNVICTWDINIGVATTTPTGTAVTPQNLNTNFFTRVSDSLSYSDEASVADGTTIKRCKTAISTTGVYGLSGIIIAKNHYIQINQETESTSGSVILIGHFESPS